MSSLFDDGNNAPDAQPPNPVDQQHAAALARLAERERRGLPSSDAEVAGLVRELAARLRAAAPGIISGGRLAEALALPDTRALRGLVAYARFGHGIREIVGIPGRGYLWAGGDKAVLQAQSDLADRMGRCWFAISAQAAEGGAEIAMAEQLLRWFPAALERAGGPGPPADDLADVMARDRATGGGLLDRLLQHMTAHRDVYGADLERVVSRHGAILVRAETLVHARQAMADAMAAFDTLTGNPEPQSNAENMRRG